MTNEEMIRSMSREELAELIYFLFIIGRFYTQRLAPYCQEPCPNSCYSCVYNWLGEEAADEKAN